MANNSITIYNKGQQNTRNDSNLSRAEKPTSSKSQFAHKPSRALKFLNIASSLNVSGAISLAGGGLSSTMASINTAKNTARKGAGIYFDYATASSGEDMRYQNKKNMLNIALKPLSFMKTLAWDYMILAPMSNARQNETLEYNRQLTNNVAFSRSMQKGQF